MTLTLVHTQLTTDTCDGVLYVDGQKLCETSEHASRALRPGVYAVLRHYCRQYGRHVPLILEHPTQDVLLRCRRCGKGGELYANTLLPVCCPQLKMGNGVHRRTDGSVLMGTLVVPGCMKHTRTPYGLLSERLRKASGRVVAVTLVVTGFPHQLPQISVRP